MTMVCPKSAFTILYAWRSVLTMSVLLTWRATCLQRGRHAAD
jgi:hypothetical protein